MTRILSRAAAVLSLLLLAACANIVDKPVRPTLFDMGPLPPITPPIERPGPRFALVVPEIDAAGALEGSAILYRLAYSRAPTPEEAALATEFVKTPAEGSGMSPWDQLAQVLLLGNEFAFVD